MHEEVTIPELTEAVARVSALLGPREGSVVQLEGGITNRNFKVRFAGTDYVLRLTGKRTDLLGIDRQAECAATKAAADLGFAPRVVTLLEEPPCLVTTFVEGEAGDAARLRDPAALKQIACDLHALHRSDTSLPVTFDPFRLGEQYAETARSHGMEPPDAYDEALAAAQRVHEAVDGRPGHDPVPAHNDLLPGNFLVDGSTICLIDWEYAGMGDRWFDLGNFAANNELSEADEETFLGEYFGETPDDTRLATLRLFRYVSDFREAMWGTVQSVLSDVEFDFGEYARRHFERLHAIREDDRFPEWIAQTRRAG